MVNDEFIVDAYKKIKEINFCWGKSVDSSDIYGKWNITGSLVVIQYTNM